jgi:hypothetical protein
MIFEDLVDKIHPLQMSLKHNQSSNQRDMKDMFYQPIITDLFLGN